GLGQQRDQSGAERQRGGETELRRARRPPVGAQDDRHIEIACRRDEAAAAPAAAGALRPRPDERALRRARARPALGLVVGAVDLGEARQPVERRKPRCGHPGKSVAVAASAAPTIGAANTTKNRMVTADAANTAFISTPIGLSKGAPAGSSKYMSLTMRR